MACDLTSVILKTGSTALDACSSTTVSIYSITELKINGEIYVGTNCSGSVAPDGFYVLTGISQDIWFETGFGSGLIKSSGTCAGTTVQFRSCEDGNVVFRFRGGTLPTTSGETYLIGGTAEFEGCATIVDNDGSGLLYDSDGVTFTLVTGCGDINCPSTDSKAAILSKCSDGVIYYFNVDAYTSFPGAAYIYNSECYSFVGFGGPGGTEIGSPSFVSCVECLPTPTPTRTPNPTPTVTPTPSITPLACTYSEFCFSTTLESLTGFNGTYSSTTSYYNSKLYYTGDGTTLGYIYYTGNEWCLSDGLGNPCYLQGKTPCYTNCPDLDPYSFTAGICPPPTPLPVDCTLLNFNAYFDCNYTPPVTPSQPVDCGDVNFDFTNIGVTPTPSNSPVYSLGLNFSINYASSTPTPTPEPTPSVTPTNRLDILGRATFVILDPPLDCPESVVLKDCDAPYEEYYIPNKLVYNGLPLQPGVFFSCLITNQNGTKYVCVQYLRNDPNVVPNTTINNINSLYANCDLCKPQPTPSQTANSTPTPTPTLTMTPTATIPTSSMRMFGFNLSAVTFDLISTNNSIIVDWGDSTTNIYPSGVLSNTVSHVYSSPFNGEINISSINLGSITALTITKITGATYSGLTNTTSEINKLSGLKSYQIGLFSNPSGSGYLSGNTLDLPRTLTFLRTNNNNLFGSTYDLPTGLTTTFIWGDNTLSGDTLGLPRPTGISYIAILGNNTISGDTSGLPQNTTFKTLSIVGQNTISGDTLGIPRYLNYCLIGGNNEISGNTLDLPRTINSTLDIQSVNNKIDGLIADLPSGTTVLSLSGVGSMTGTTLDLPSGLTRCFINGPTYINGNTLDLPRKLTQLEITLGFDNITGDTAGLPTGLTYCVISGGTSNISGNVSQLPVNINYLGLFGNNTISGDTSGMSSLPLITLSLYGNNTISGDTANLPNTLERIAIGGNNSMTGYTSGYVWNSTMSSIEITTNLAGVGYTSNAISDILIDLDSSVTTWENPKYISLKGIDSPKRTPASDAAVNNLTGGTKQVTIVLT